MNDKNFLIRVGQMVLGASLFMGTHSFGQSFTQDMPFNPSPFTSSTMPESIVFETFDQEVADGNIPAGQMLTSVQTNLVSVSTAANGSVTNTSTTTTATNVQFDLHGSNFLKTSNGTLVNQSFDTGFQDENDLAPNTAENVPEVDLGPSTATPKTINSSSMNATDMANIALFTNNSGGGGGPSVTLTLSSTISVGGSASFGTGMGSIAAAGSESSTGTVEVIYFYAPVPEPSQTAAWMLGFVGLLFVGGKFVRRTPAVQPIA